MTPIRHVLVGFLYVIKHWKMQKGGDSISFVKEFFNVSFGDAVGILLGGFRSSIEDRPAYKEVPKEFKVPEKNPRMNRVVAYLTSTRGIPYEVVKAFIDKGLIYEEKGYHNAVFVGVNRDNEPKHIHMRGTGSQSTFKMTVSGSDPNYSFHWNGKNNELYLFEAPIDMLSYISMNQENWENSTYAAACSVTDKVLLQCLKDNSEIDTIHICFDNDIAGQNAYTRVKSKLEDMGLKVDVLVPEHKDWNEDLIGGNELDIKLN